MEAKVSKARQVALQKEGTKNDGFLALVIYLLTRSSGIYYVPILP